jgi:L-ascorbate metabolism protein UlaG (beta-lactamase superfamily)
MKCNLFTFLLLFPALTLFSQDMQVDESAAFSVPPGGRIEVTYIANSGFLLSSGTTRVLIDALYLDADIWESPSRKIQKAIVSGNAPFRNISHMLVSHYHADHFDAALTSRFLINNPGAMLLTNAQTDSVLQKIYRQDPELKRPKQTRIIQSPMFGTETYEADDLKVKCLMQRHMGQDDFKVVSMGFLVEMGGKKILHIGDAGWTDENFAGFNLQDENIDIAFIHYWFLLDCEGRRILDTQIKPKKIVITHIPYEELRRNFKRIKEYYPDVEVFLNHLEKKIY